MSTMKDKLYDFDQVLKGFEEKSHEQLMFVEEKQEYINNLLKLTLTKINSQLDELLIKKDHPYYEVLLELKENISNSLNKIINEDLRVAVEKQHFYKEHLDSFVISVYGKVKTGKSSLSNLLGGYYLRNYPGNRPTFFRYEKDERNGEYKKIDLDESEGFFVDTLEATCSIQGFKKERLIWIDTPGLDATEQNAKISRDYIESSDLVLFLTPGNSPLRKGDLEKLNWLYKRNKPTLLIITKSDNTGEPVEINGELIEDYICGKSHKGKQDQLRYIKKEYEGTELLDFLQAHGKILHISTFLALYGFQESDLFEDRVVEHFSTYLDYDNRLIPNINWSEESQLLSLLEQIKIVLASNSVQYKTENPKRRLKAFIREDLLNEKDGKISVLVESLKIALQSLSNLKSIISKTQGEKEKDKLILKVENAINKVLLKYHNNTEFNKEKINRELNEQVVKTIEAFIDEQIKKIIEAYKENLVINFKKLDIDIRTISEESEVEVNDPLVQFLIKTGATLLGVAIGSIFGPSGRRIGMVIGSMAGDILGELVTTTKVIKVDIGNDLVLQRDKIIEDVCSQSIDIYESVFLQIESQYVEPLLNSFLMILDDIIHLRKELEKVEIEVIDSENNAPIIS